MFVVFNHNTLFVLDPEMSLDVKKISVQDISLILGHTLHYRMEPSLFATILPYMNSIISNALSKIFILFLHVYVGSLEGQKAWDRSA